MIMTEQLVVDKITVIKYCTLLPAVKDDKCNYYIKMSVKMLRHSFAHTRCNWDKLDMTTIQIHGGGFGGHSVKWGIQEPRLELFQTIISRFAMMATDS